MSESNCIFDQKHQYAEEWKFIQKVLNQIEEKLSPQVQLNTSTIVFSQPRDLEKKLNFSLDSSACGLDSLVKVCSDIIDNSVKTCSPMFFQQLFHGVDPYGLAGSFLIEALNTSNYTYDVGPVVTLIEKEVTETLVKLIGWQEGEGIFCPGGSIANMYAVSVARHKFDKSIKIQGMMKQKKLAIFASDQAHYSVIKAASFMGFGVESVIKVKSDDFGRMDVNELKDKIRQSHHDEDCQPFMVWCTSGTTVLNAYDPLLEINSICIEFGLWMHVDACLGGAALWSTKHKHLLEAVDRSDSLSWSWHKVLGAPFQTSLFLTKHKGSLNGAHSACANYLFLNTKHYDTSYDTGDASIQCGRKPDALKVWFMLKARGPAQIEQMVNAAFDSAKYLVRKLHENNRFRLVLPEAQGTTVCFWVIPPSLRNEPMTAEYNERLNEVAPTLKKRMVETGLCMVTYQPMTEKSLPIFVRVTFMCHPISTNEVIDKLIEILVHLSDDL